MKKYVYRSGDCVRIKNSKFIKRVGYNLVWYDLIDEVENDPRTYEAWRVLTGESKFSSKICNLFKVEIKSQIPQDFIRAIAKIRVDERGFGGKERKIHYLEESKDETLIIDSSKFTRDYTGIVTHVSSKRIVKTGTYYRGYSSYEDSEPGGLEDMKTHVLLMTNLGEIEECNVELVKSYNP